MRFSIFINQVAAVEWGLNLNQAAVFGFIYEASSWATKDGDYWNVSKHKIIEEFPLLTDKVDTVYRLIKVLVDKGLLDKKLIDGKDFYKVTEKGLLWNSSGSIPRVGKKSEQRKIIRNSSEKNPNKLGKKSDVLDNQVLDNQVLDKKTSAKKLADENSSARKKPRPSSLDYSPWPELPDQQILDDWVEHRKQSNAKVSQTVINRYAKELHKAAQLGYTVSHCLSEVVCNGWRGFEAQWLVNREIRNQASNQIPIRTVEQSSDFVNKHTDTSWAE